MRINIEKSKDNYDLLYIENGRKFYLGSKYNQKREIEKFKDCIEPVAINDIILVFGLGGIDCIKEIRKQSFKKLVIIEPVKDIYKAIKNIDSYKEILEDERVEVIYELEDINNLYKFIDITTVESVKTYINTGYDVYFKEQLDVFVDEISKLLIKVTIERNTNNYFQDRWTETFLRNYKFFAESIELVNLKNKFKGIPAIVVSAGPSLDKNIRELKDFTKGVIISGGRTLRSLLEIEVSPDFTVSIDPGEISYNIIKDYMNLCNTSLVYHCGTNDKIVENFSGNKILGINDSFVEEILEKDNIDLRRGGSVAHSMVEFAKFIGCNPIIMIGQDLAYTDRKMHSEMSRNKNSTYNYEAFKRNDDVITKDIYGNDILTSLTFLLFKQQMEEIIDNSKGVEFINATEGGLHIDGTIDLSLREVINTLKIKNVPKKELDFNNLFEDKSILFQEKINKSYISIKKIIEVTENLKADIKKYSLYIQKENIIQANRLNDKIEKLEKDLKKELKNVSFLSTKINSLICKLNNNKEFKVYNSDIKNIIVKKNLRKNYEIYDGINSMAKKSKIEVKKTKDYLERKIENGVYKE